MVTAIRKTETITGSNQALRVYVQIFRIKMKEALEPFTNKKSAYVDKALLSNLQTATAYLKDGLYDHEKHESSLFSDPFLSDLIQKGLELERDKIMDRVWRLESALARSGINGFSEEDMMRKHSGIKSMTDEIAQLICEYTTEEDYVAGLVEKAIESREGTAL